MSNSSRRLSTYYIPSQNLQTNDLEKVLSDATLLARLVSQDPRARQLNSQREQHLRALHLLRSWADTGSASVSTAAMAMISGPQSAQSTHFGRLRLRGNAERARLLEKRLAGGGSYDWRSEQKKVDGMRIMRENILLFGRLMRLHETPGPLNGERLKKDYVHKQLTK